MKTTSEILEEIFDSGYVTNEIKIGKYVIVIRNITAVDYMEMDTAFKDNNMTKVGFSHLYIIERVSRIIVSINNKKFETVDECKEFLKKWPSKIVDKLLEEHKALEEAIQKAITPEEVDDHFFDKGDSPQS